jgi:hypothetical protein
MSQCDKCEGSGQIKGYQQQTDTPYTLECGKCAGLGTVPVFYAGIGSRDTPQPIGLEMQSIAMQLAMRGFVLRSGAAKPRKDAPPGTVSADAEFEKGCRMVNGRCIIRLATGHSGALEHARQFHPKWDACSEYAQMLHARNSLIMLGDYMDVPVSFVVCWTPGGAVTGGTGQALRVAAHYGIPVFNLAVQPASALWEWLQ